MRPRALVVATLWMLTGVLGPVRGQSLPEQPPSEAAIPIGPTLLYPFFTSTVEQSDNVFQQPEGNPSNQSAVVTTIIPGALLLVPFSHSEASLGYAVRYRDYALENGSDGGIDPYTHYLRGAVRLVFGNGMFTEAREELRRGVVDTQTIEGGEVVFTGENQHHDLTEVQVGREHGVRRLWLAAGTTKDEIVGERRSQIFDVDAWHARAGAQLPIRSNLRTQWELRGHHADLDNTLIQRTEDQLEGRVGARWELGGKSNLDLSTGWIYSKYGLDGEQTLSVPFGAAGYERELGNGGRFLTRAERNVYPSVEEDSPYYVSDQINATYSNADLARVGYGLQAIFFRNDYRSATRGQDRTLAGEAWIGYRLGRWIQARGFLYWSARNSTLPEFEYRALSGGLSLMAGPY